MYLNIFLKKLIDLFCHPFFSIKKKKNWRRIRKASKGTREGNSSCSTGIYENVHVYRAQRASK